MNNCFFEDYDFTTSVHPLSFIKEDDHGYYIDIKINKKDVVNFMMLGLIPTFIKDKNIFAISVAINHSTKTRINGIHTKSLDFTDNRLQQIPSSIVSIRELGLKIYSKKSNKKDQQCYATVAIFHIKTPVKFRNQDA